MYLFVTFRKCYIWANQQTKKFTNILLNAGKMTFSTLVKKEIFLNVFEIHLFYAKYTINTFTYLST